MIEQVPKCALKKLGGFGQTLGRKQKSVNPQAVEGRHRLFKIEPLLDQERLNGLPPRMLQSSEARL